MHALYDLREMLCKQLDDYGKKGELSAAVLERVDMLAHAVKNLDKVIDSMDGEGKEYSGSMYSGRRYDDGHSAGRGHSTRRDSMGRYASDGYSRGGDLADQLRDMMVDAPDERTRQEIQHLVSKLESR